MNESVENEVVQEKPYTLRELKSKDVFLMVKILTKIGLNDFGKCFDGDEIKRIVESLTEDSDKTVTTVGSAVGITVALKLANVILEHISDADKEIYRFLSAVTELSEEEVEDLRMDYFTELIYDVFNRPEFLGFMKVASKFVK